MYVCTYVSYIYNVFVTIGGTSTVVVMALVWPCGCYGLCNTKITNSIVDQHRHDSLCDNLALLDTTGMFPLELWGFYHCRPVLLKFQHCS